MHYKSRVESAARVTGAKECVCIVKLINSSNVYQDNILCRHQVAHLFRIADPKLAFMAILVFFYIQQC